MTQYKYKDLRALKEAYDHGDLTEPIILDNDCSMVYVDDVMVYDGAGPESLLQEALDLLEIPHSHV